MIKLLLLASLVAPTVIVDRCGSVDAFVMLRNDVKEQLAIPSSARFPYSSEARTKEMAKCLFMVASYVYAKNVTGATRRLNWWGITKMHADGSWETIVIKVGG